MNNSNDKPILTERDIERNTNCLIAIIVIIVIILLVNPLSALWNHDQMHDESAAASRYEETIIIDAQNINKEFTQEQVYDELLKSGEYKSIRIDDDQIEIIVDQKYSDYWNGVIERYLN